MWASAKGCLRKVTSITLVTTALLWVLLNVPVRSDEDMAAAPAPLEALRGRDGARCRGPLTPARYRGVQTLKEPARAGGARRQHMAEPIHIGAAADIPEGESRVIPAQTAGTRDDVAVFHAEDGAFYAIDDTCTHEDASLAEGWLEGTKVECPLHSAEFCLRSGEALCLPATKPVGTHAVEARDGQLYLTPGE